MIPQFYQAIHALDRLVYSYPFVLLPIFASIFSLFMLGMIVYISVFATGLLKTYIMDFINAWRRTVIPTGKFRKRWEKIQEYSNATNEEQWHRAVIEADTMLGAVIEAIGYGGATMDERMRAIKQGNFPYLEEAWKAHQVRVFLEQDPTHRLNEQTLAHVMKIYESIFQELDIL